MRPVASRHLGFVILAFGALDLGHEQSVVVPALPLVARQEGASADSVAWLLTGFLLASAVALPLAARLGDQLGRQRVLLGSLAAFAAGSLVCALAGSLAGLVAGRVLQGGGAAAAALAAGIVREHLPASRVPGAVGLLLAAAGAGYAIGLAVGGALAEHVSVAAVFWFLFALAVALLLLAALVVPRDAARERAPVDWVGAVLLAAGGAAPLLAISRANDWGWAAAPTLALLVGGVVVLAAFAVLELRVPAPLVDVRLMSRRSLASANLAAFAIGLGLFVAAVVIPQLAALPEATGFGLGLGATDTGLLLVPGAAAILVSGALGGRLAGRIGTRTLVCAGALCATAAYLGLAQWHATAAQLAAANTLLGVGIGLSLAAIATLVVASVERGRTSGSVGVNGLVRIVGSALGAQVAAAIVTPAAGALAPAEGDFQDAFVFGAIAAGVAVLLASTLPGRDRDPVVAQVQGLSPG
jgi:MFS family permease